MTDIGVPGTGIIEGVEVHILESIMDPRFKRRLLLFVSSVSCEGVLPRKYKVLEVETIRLTLIGKNNRLIT